jgi:rhamnose transport system substrate-binding protein
LLAFAAALVASMIAGCGENSSAPAPGETQQRTRIGLVAKSLGNGFFDAVNKGANEAAAALNAEVIFTGPTTPSAEGQIEVLNALIAQRVDAIAISANDPDALVPTLKRAMQRGIKVISYDSAVAAEGRIAHLAPSSDELIGQTVAQLAAELAPNARGKIAVVSATPTSTNQNAWLAALSSVGLVAAAKAIEDQGLGGKVHVTGLGLPSELAGYVRSGVVPKFAIWNPIDLGYAATQIAVRLSRGESAKEPISIERLGSVTFDENGVGAMGKPFIYDASNIAEFEKVF